MTNTTQTSSIPVSIFTGENYDYWSVKMKTFFGSQDLWDIVEEGFIAPTDTLTLTAAQKKELKENKQKDSRALYILQQAVGDVIFPRIMNATNVKDAWRMEKHLVYLRSFFKNIRLLPSTLCLIL